MVSRKMFLLIILLLCSFLEARVVSKARKMYNSDLLYCDSIWVDSLSTAWTLAIPADIGRQYSLWLEARDDSTAGFASDSACVTVDLYQGAPISKGTVGYFVLQRSRAHPDSTYPGSRWRLFDSLDIRSMDTACVYNSNSWIDSVWGQPRSIDYGDTIKTLTTTGTFGAWKYIDFAPDYSPILTFRFTGLSPNKKRGPGSRWIIRLYQLNADIVKQR